MAGWFAKLMQKAHARSRRATVGAGFSKDTDAGRNPDVRDPRYDAIVQALRDREAEDREAREKRQLRYRQYLKSGSGPESSVSDPCPASRLYRLRTKVPCRMTPEARALLLRLKKQFSGGTVTFRQVTSRRQAVMLTGATGTEPKQIGWVEHCVQPDPKLCNVRNQGLAVETDGGTMLVLRFRYPPTAVRMSSRHTTEERALPHGSRVPVSSTADAMSIDTRTRNEGLVSLSPGRDGLELLGDAIDEVASVDFTEIRAALDLRPSDKCSPPRLVWITHPEVQAMNALGSRDYEAFYVRFKLEVQAGIWNRLSGLLSSSPGSQWQRGSYYTVVREPDAANGRIHQRTVDDGGRAVDIGADRIFDAATATDTLLLYLEGDVLADFADIYFTLQSLTSTDAYFLKEEFFRVIRRFWATSPSLASRYGSDLAAVVRMSQRAVPMPAQALLLKQDWTNLRQSLIDRYGEGGRKAADLVDQDAHRPHGGRLEWPFATFPAGEVNIGLRLIYRQEWRCLGAQRGDVVRTVPPTPRPGERESTTVGPGTRTGLGVEDLRSVETSIEHSDTTRSLSEIVHEAAKATVETMKWHLEVEGSINTGVRALAARTDMGLESECRESSRDTSTRLGDIMLRMASQIRDESSAVVSTESGEGVESSPPTGTENPADDDGATYVYSRLQHWYEVLTRPVEIRNVVLVAEKLPTPAEIDLSWARRHDWILAKVLLDESFRDALDTIAQEPPEHLERGLELDAKRERLCEHLRANILHYQRAIWQQEDPQQRSMRYRKSGKKVPLEWRFELDSGGALTIDELGDRLAATNVDGQFAAYSAGREADLDQVIDPAGPIGYCGNYAIYHMRPEFGSEDLFSMLHFFKSPYLRPNPETGEPEVEDPAQIHLSEDPAVVAASDRVIDQHRDEMFEYVPELRRELARARKTVSGETDPGADDRLKWPSGALRRHFATYLFRRERTRRIAVDTGGLVIDVIRSTEPVPESSERSDGGIVRGEAPDGYQLIADNRPGIELLSASGHPGAEAGWAILAGGGERMPSLLAGAGVGAQAQDSEAERVILARDDEARVPGLRAGRAHDPEPEPLVLARGGGEPTSSVRVGRAHAPEAERAIRARDDAEPRLTAVSGAGAARAPAKVILARDDGGPSLTSVASGGASEAPERVILARDDAASMPGLRAGRAHDPDAERVILAGADEEPIPSLHAGRTHDSGAEPAIVARSDAERMPSLSAGRVPAPDTDAVILARDDGARRLTAVVGAGAADAQEPVILARGDGERMPSLRAGGPLAPEPERVILARAGGGPRLTTVTGGGAAHSRERTILAEGDEVRIPGLRAGAGAGHAHERVILARDDEWLRPSLVAG